TAYCRCGRISCSCVCPPSGKPPGLGAGPASIYASGAPGMPASRVIAGRSNQNHWLRAGTLSGESHGWRASVRSTPSIVTGPATAPPRPPLGIAPVGRDPAAIDQDRRPSLAQQRRQDEVALVAAQRARIDMDLMPMVEAARGFDAAEAAALGIGERGIDRER